MEIKKQWQEIKEKFRDICGTLSMEEILGNVELMERIIKIEAILNLKSDSSMEVRS